MSSALEGLKVLDFTQMMNGPFGTMLLADFGADVIKVEPPAGDTMRLTGETFLGDDAVYFLTLNRNKRSVVLDLATEEGQRMAQEMAKQVDIVVENFRPGVAEKLGISYETLSSLNPRLIYCSTSAFGRTGPDSIRPGMDPVVQAMSGIMQLTGNETFIDLSNRVSEEYYRTLFRKDFGGIAIEAPELAAGSNFQWLPWGPDELCGIPAPAELGKENYQLGNRDFHADRNRLHCGASSPGNDFALQREHSI